jgi:hypothetical protein
MNDIRSDCYSYNSPYYGILYITIMNIIHSHSPYHIMLCDYDHQPPRNFPPLVHARSMLASVTLRHELWHFFRRETWPSSTSTWLKISPEFWGKPMAFLDDVSRTSMYNIVEHCITWLVNSMLWKNTPQNYS